MSASTVLEYEFNGLITKIDEYLELREIDVNRSKTATEMFRLDRLNDYEYNQLNWSTGLEKSGDGILAAIADFFSKIIDGIKSLFGLSDKQSKWYEDFRKNYEDILNNEFSGFKSSSKPVYKKPIHLHGCFTDETLSKLASSEETVDSAFGNFANDGFVFIKMVERELLSAAARLVKTGNYSHNLTNDEIKTKYFSIQDSTMGKVKNKCGDVGLKIDDKHKLLFKKDLLPIFPEGKTISNTDKSELEKYINSFNSTRVARVSVKGEVIRHAMEQLMALLNDAKDGLIKFIKGTRNNSSQQSPNSNDNSPAVVNKPKVDERDRSAVIKDLRQLMLISMNSVIWYRAFLYSQAYRIRIGDAIVQRFKAAL